MTWRWDFDHQSYSRDGSGSLGLVYFDLRTPMGVGKSNYQTYSDPNGGDLPSGKLTVRP